MNHENEQHSLDRTSIAKRPTAEHRNTYNRTDVPTPSTRTIAAVAEALEVDETDLPPLNDVVDLDALDALFAPQFDGSPRPGGRVSFQYLDHDVLVCEDGTVIVTPVEK